MKTTRKHIICHELNRDEINDAIITYVGRKACLGPLPVVRWTNIHSSRDKCTVTSEIEEEI